MELLDSVIEKIGKEVYYLGSEPEDWKDAIQKVASKNHRTYHDKQNTRFQCHKLKNRSIIDIIRVTLGHFPDVPILEILEYISKEMLENNLVVFWCKDIGRTVKLPKNAIEFVQKFDKGKETNPIEFELDIPTWFLKPSYFKKKL